MTRIFHTFRGHRMSVALIKELTAPQVYMYNSSGQMSNAAVGAQAVATGLSILNATDMVQIFDAQSQSVGGPALGNFFQSIYLLNAYAEVWYQNNSLNNATFDLYDLVCKRDSQELPSNAWGQFIADLQGNLAGGSTLTSTLFGMTPFDAPKFNLNWKVLKKTTYELAAGQGVKHIITLKYNKIINHEILNANSVLVVPIFFNGYTYSQLLVLRGYPCHNVAASGNVSASTTTVDFQANVRIGYRWRNPVRQLIDYVSTFPAIPNANEVIANQGGTLRNVGDPRT